MEEGKGFNVKLEEESFLTFTKGYIKQHSTLSPP